jgi:hypothetical protein
MNWEARDAMASTTCELSEAINTLVNIATSIESGVQFGPQEAEIIRLAGLTLVSKLTTDYGQEYFTFEEIELVESLYYTLTDDSGEFYNEQ